MDTLVLNEVPYQHLSDHDYLYCSCSRDTLHDTAHGVCSYDDSAFQSHLHNPVHIHHRKNLKNKVKLLIKFTESPKYRTW